MVRNLSELPSQPNRSPIIVAAIVGVIGLLVSVFVVYTWIRVYVPPKHIAVMVRKTGQDLPNDMECAPDATYKGIQREVLTEGRYFRDPYNWKWTIYPMVEVPQGKMGVRIRLHGKELPYGELVANGEQYKGIVPEILPPGRYALNAKVIEVDSEGSRREVNQRPAQDYLEIVELHDPVTIPAGFKGVVTNLSGKLPEDPNVLLVESGFRGVQRETLDEGSYYLNPYIFRVDPIDCRSQRYNLSEGEEMGFPSKDGFWVSLDGRIEFRVKPDQASLVYVLYNESVLEPDSDPDIGSAIIRKVIMPNARSFCRLRGSNSSGREFIGGETRAAFQEAFQAAIRETCSAQGIEIIQALITRINPPQAIAGPVREREVANQTLRQYQQQRLQQEQEALLATEMALVVQREQLVEADRNVIRLVTEARKRQEVALAEATRDRDVAGEQLAAAKDLASAVVAERSAEAAVVRFTNEAEAAGWKEGVQAFNGDGDAYARFFLYQKLAPGYRSIMTNTANSPLMEVFRNLAASAAPEAGQQPAPDLRQDNDNLTGNPPGDD